MLSTGPEETRGKPSSQHIDASCVPAITYRRTETFPLANESTSEQLYGEVVETSKWQ